MPYASLEMRKKYMHNYYIKHKDHWFLYKGATPEERHEYNHRRYIKDIEYDKNKKTNNTAFLLKQTHN